MTTGGHKHVRWSLTEADCRPDLGYHDAFLRSRRNLLLEER